MPEITCAVVADLLDAYLAGETSEDTNRVLREHIDGCPACQAALMRGRRAAEAMAAARPPATRVEVSEDSSDRRVIGRARCRLYAGIAVALVLAVVFLSLGLDRVYALRVASPARVAGIEEYAASVVPGWDMARALGAVQDVHEEIDDWLTIDSALFGSDGTYVLYTTTNRTKVEFTAGGPVASDRGAVSPSGFHGIVILPPVPTSIQASAEHGQRGKTGFPDGDRSH